MTSASARSTSSSVSGRGMSARASTDSAIAVELLDAADVGDRLAQFPPVDQGQVLRLRVGPDRRVAVRDDRRPVDADRVREQQLGIQPRRLGAGRAQALDAGLHQRAGRGHRARVRAGS